MALASFFLVSHANVHAGEVGGSPSYFDRVLARVSDAQMRARPAKGVNSLVWLLWHMAWAEDACVNLVVSDGRQVLYEGWARRMNVPACIIGTGMTDEEVQEITEPAGVAGVRAVASGSSGVPRPSLGVMSPTLSAPSTIIPL